MEDRRSSDVESRRDRRMRPSARKWSPSRALVRAFLFAWALAGAGRAAGAAPAWSYDTVTEPFDRPSWVERIVFVEVAYNNPFEDPGMTKLVPWCRKLREAGFTIFAPAPLEWIGPLHAAGIKVIRGMRPFIAEDWKEELIKSHREWLRVTDRGVPSGENEACLLSPFGDALIELLAANLKKYDLDGYQFDGWYQMKYCRCEACRKMYLEERGLEVPPKEDPLDLGYRKYLVWRDEKLFERAVRLRKAIKEVKPEAILVNWSNNDANGCYPSCMGEALNCVFDLTTKEWWDTSDVYSIWLNKRLRGSAGDRAQGMEPYMFMRGMLDIKAGVYHGSSAPMEELLYQIHETMAMGAVPWVWPGARAGFKGEDWERVIRDYVEYLPYVHGTRTLKYAACLDSYTTLQMSKIPLDIADFHGGLSKRIDARVAAGRGGMARALLEEHIPFDVISEHNLSPETLGRYRVVILPNDFCMSDGVAAKLRDHVAGGGGLVATFESSLFDGWGERRKDFALSDLFGASHVDSREACPSRVAFAAASHSVTDDPKLRDLMGSKGYTTYWGRFARVKLAPGAVAPLTGLDVEYEKDASLKDWTPLLLSESGKGRTAYFPAAIDAAYFEAGYPYERILIANAARWAARAKPPVRVIAPLCVVCGFLTKEEGGLRQTIVHLLNGICTTLGHGSAADQEYAFREEVLPIHDISVEFDGERPERALLVPGGKPLEVQGAAEGWKVVVPRLDLHAVVVAEHRRER